MLDVLNHLAVLFLLCRSLVFLLSQLRSQQTQLLVESSSFLLLTLLEAG